MSNSYFQFKQFNINQDRCAMKVTTDACILGAWTPIPALAKRVLDIGTGTGLLSLMLAQRFPFLTVDAVEIDMAAAEQAKDNIRLSPWPDRINVIGGDARNLPATGQYDVIVTNPPFFQNSLLSQNGARSSARHDVNLSYTDLLTSIKKMLSPLGFAAILLPEIETSILELVAVEYGFQAFQRLFVRHTEHAPVKRVVSLLAKNTPCAAREETLIIKDSRGHYTPHFCALLGAFYLGL